MKEQKTIEHEIQKKYTDELKDCLPAFLARDETEVYYSVFSPNVGQYRRGLGPFPDHSLLEDNVFNGDIDLVSSHKLYVGEASEIRRVPIVEASFSRDYNGSDLSFSFERSGLVRVLHFFSVVADFAVLSNQDHKENEVLTMLRFYGKEDMVTPEMLEDL